MSKHIETEYYVRVDPDFFLRHTDEAKFRHCQDVADQIKRHVDGLDAVCVNGDSETTCSFCGYPWEDPPQCCDDAIAENKVEHTDD